jgi:hypothetical protein
MRPLSAQLEKTLADILELAEREGKKTGFCIGNTTKRIDHDHCFTPIRNTALCVCGSVLIDKVEVAEEIVRVLDGRVDYFFVDTEKKISPSLYGAHDVGNVERAVREGAKRSRVLTFKGNDLTVDAIDCFLAQLVLRDVQGIGGKKVAIVGAGNIGFKIALKLLERGAHVFMVRRDREKLELLTRTLNAVKPVGTLARVTGTTDVTEAMKDADVVIGLTPGARTLDGELVSLLKDGAALIDAGKGSFSIDGIEEAERRGMAVYRTSITASFEGQVAMLLKMEGILERSLGRRTVEGIAIIAGSLLGRKGEIVVDDIEQPTQIYGVADGCGDFNREPSEEERLAVEKLSRLLEAGKGALRRP